MNSLMAQKSSNCCKMIMGSLDLAVLHIKSVHLSFKLSFRLQQNKKDRCFLEPIEADVEAARGPKDVFAEVLAPCFKTLHSSIDGADDVIIQ